jgi:hypothetical protein
LYGKNWLFIFDKILKDFWHNGGMEKSFHPIAKEDVRQKICWDGPDVVVISKFSLREILCGLGSPLFWFTTA